jgi:hypothetical protein
MADFGIKPDIALGVKGPQPQSVSDLLGTATKAMEYSRLSELYPELIKKTTAEAKSAQLGAEKAGMGLNVDKAQQITNGQVSLMFNPLVVQAAKGERVDTKALINAVTENAKIQSQNAGIDWETQGKQLAAPYIARAQNDPASLQGYIKERMFAGLDQATRASMMTPEPISGLPAPATFTAAEGIARPLEIQGQRPSVARPEVPLSVPPAGQPSSRGAGVTPEMLTAPIGQPAAPAAKPQAAPSDPGYPLRFPPRAAGDIRPFAPGEENARATGEKTRTALVEAQSSVPKAQRSVSEVIRVANDLAKDVRFQTGRPADIERAIRTTLGEDRYKELSKDIANAQLALLKAEGGNLETDAGKALVARATGDETYPPDVLVKIARRLNGQLAEVDARATGAQAFARRFGDSNLPEFQQQWSRNSDLRIFEMMAAVRDIRNPKDQKAALDAILPKNPEELREMMQKYENIKRLTATGTLR